MKTFQEVSEYAEKQNFVLRVDDFNKKEVIINHQDGSKFKITNAKLEKHDVIFKGITKKEIKKKVIIVFSEHHNPFVYFEEDLKSFKVKK